MKKWILWLIAVTGTLPLAAGGVVLTFDDFYLQSWSDQSALFDRYDVKVTFFITQPQNFQARQWEQLEALAAAGHQIGLHGMNHRSIIEYLKSGGDIPGYIAAEIVPERELLKSHGIDGNCFAMPYSHRTPETDAALQREFSWIRSGLPVSPKMPSRDCNEFFTPTANISRGMVIIAKSLDYFDTDGFPDRTAAEIGGMLDRAKERDEWVAFYIHNITPAAKNNFIRPDKLELLLQMIKERNLLVRPLPVPN